MRSIEGWSRVCTQIQYWYLHQNTLFSNLWVVVISHHASGWMGALHASGHWFDSRWGNYLTKFSPDWKTVWVFHDAENLKKKKKKKYEMTKLDDSSVKKIKIVWKLKKCLKIKRKRRTDVPDLAELKSWYVWKHFVGPPNTNCSRWGPCMLNSL